MSADPWRGRPDASPAAAPGASGRVRYASTVQAIGEMIPEFLEQRLLIFFGEMAPEELHDFVVRHRPSVADSVPRPGDVIELDDARLVITAVGDVVADNLLRLGHFALKADGSTTPPMPGDICVEVGPLPQVHLGSTLRILATADDAGGTDPAMSGDPGSVAPSSQES